MNVKVLSEARGLSLVDKVNLVISKVKEVYPTAIVEDVYEDRAVIFYKGIVSDVEYSIAESENGYNVLLGNLNEEVISSNGFDNLVFDMQRLFEEAGSENSKDDIKEAFQEAIKVNPLVGLVTYLSYSPFKNVYEALKDDIAEEKDIFPHKIDSDIIGTIEESVVYDKMDKFLVTMESVYNELLQVLSNKSFVQKEEKEDIEYLQNYAKNLLDIVNMLKEEVEDYSVEDLVKTYNYLVDELKGLVLWNEYTKKEIGGK